MPQRKTAAGARRTAAAYEDADRLRNSESESSRGQKTGQQSALAALRPLVAAVVNDDRPGPRVLWAPRPQASRREARIRKLTIRCVRWRPFCRNTLRGDGDFEVVEMRMILREITIHERDGKAWAQPPARPWIKDGKPITGDDGKIRYSPPLIGFVGAAVRQAFSNAVLRAVLAFDPNALARAEDVA